MKKLTYVAPLALAAAALLAAGTPETLARGREVSTLHIEVIEDDGDSPKVKMAMPVALIEAMVRSIDIDEFTSKHFLGELEHEGFDLRRFWKEVRDADIKEFPTNTVGLGKISIFARSKTILNHLFDVLCCKKGISSSHFVLQILLWILFQQTQ